MTFSPDEKRPGMKTEDKTETERTDEPSLWANIGRIVLLVAVLAAAWFVLEWLMGGK